MRQTSSVLSELDPRIYYFPIEIKANYTILELIASQIVFRYDIDKGPLAKLTNRLALREYQKIYGSYEFDKLVILSCRTKRLYWILRCTSDHRILCLGRQEGLYNTDESFRRQVDYLLKRRADFERVVLSEELAKKKGLKKDSNIVVCDGRADFEEIWREEER